MSLGNGTKEREQGSEGGGNWREGIGPKRNYDARHTDRIDPSDNGSNVALGKHSYKIAVEIRRSNSLIAFY